MHFLEPALFILLLAIIATPLAARLRLPLEAFLVIGSSIISLLPNLPTIEVDPDVVFKILLPPILFNAAYFTSWRDFKFNFRVICQLAIGLVIFSSILVAIVCKLIFPDISWAEGLLLGAIVSPTDASAATTITKKLNAPRRFIAILEGESLVNDAMALLLFKFSLAAVVVGSFSMAGAITQFFLITSGGALVGLAIGYLVSFIIQNLQNVEAETTLSIIAAYTCFLSAGYFGFSGVIATVVCGLYFGVRFPQLSTSRTRLAARASWNTFIFIINGAAFTLLGLELPVIVKSLQTISISELILSGLLISVIVIIARVVWVFTTAYLVRAVIPAIRKSDPLPKVSFLFLISWCGMRGIVSLAAALSLPYQLYPGVSFPHRDFFLFSTYCVIFVTLIFPSLTLPPFLRWFGYNDPESKLQAEAGARITALQAAIDKIEALKEGGKISPELFKEFHQQFERRLKVIHSHTHHTPYSTLNEEYSALKKMTLLAIESERDALHHLRKSGDIDEDLFHQLLDELDFEEMRARSMRL